MRFGGDSRPAALRARRWLALGALSCAATVAFAQAALVKCVDADGNVTYQDSPCTAGQTGRNVELPKAESKEDTTEWEAAARDAKVVRGMPKRWVLRARGAPAEIRPGTARDEASEVWRYSAGLVVGFAGPNVAWAREEAPARASPPAPAAVTATPLRGAHNRRFVIAGRYCEHVFAEIGPADREELLPGAAARRYIYEPQAGDPSIRTAFSCLDGKVADVERTVVR
ncbi:MAG: DUF4124 domain-containing protein [Burkholderiales bacterium]|nr:DUF4124 domain-containing protein [Burkholderiales bacterium]